MMYIIFVLMYIVPRFALQCFHYRSKRDTRKFIAGVERVMFPKCHVLLW